jgi:hypothetical protein
MGIWKNQPQFPFDQELMFAARKGSFKTGLHERFDQFFPFYLWGQTAQLWRNEKANLPISTPLLK